MGNEQARSAHTSTDEDLIRAFQTGDEGAFVLLVGRYKGRLITYVYRFLGDYDDADDVVQETFMRVYHHKDSYHPIAKFSTWIYTIAGNLARTHLRKRSLFRYLRFGSEPGERHHDIPSEADGPDMQTDRILLSEKIQKALGKLSPTYREVVILRDIQDLPYEEIAKITGLEIGTVKSRLNRGRTRLQLLLRDVINES